MDGTWRPQPPDEISWRLQALERRLDRLDEADVFLLAERITVQAHELQIVVAELRALRRALYAFAFAIAASATVYMLATTPLGN